MKNINRSFSLLCVLLLLGLSPLSMAQTYQIIKNNSKVHWTGTKPGGSHYGTVSITKGHLELSNNVVTGGKFTIDLNTIVNDDLESETWNKKLVDHLKSEDFFYVDKYPVSTFEISKTKKVNENDYHITGILTIKETSKTISFNASVNSDNGKIIAQTENIVIDRTQWKVEAMSKSVFSDLKDNYVDDEITIKVSLEADKP